MQTPTPDIAHGGSYQVDPATGSATLISRAQQHPDEPVTAAPAPAATPAPKASSLTGTTTVQPKE
jgi:hypothetical protein